MGRKEHDDFVKLEAELLEQEHRITSLIYNFFYRKKKWEKSDPRYVAANKAIIFRVFFSPSTIAVLGSSTAIVSLLVILYQNSLIAHQNELIEEQNNYFREQITFQGTQWNSQQRNEYIDTLYSKNNNCMEIGCEVENSRAKAEAAIAFIKLEHLRIKSQFKDKDDLQRATHPPYVPDLSYLNLSGVNMGYGNFNNVYFFKSILNGIDLRWSEIHSSNFVDSQFEEALFINSKMTLCHMQRSNGAKARFTYADMEDCIFLNGNFEKANFEHANLKDTDFRATHVSGASFKYADVTGADFTLSDITSEQLSEACSGGGTITDFEMDFEACAE
jgi:uncharacterized protein YjbI with pentapeptide repeats